MIDLIPDRHLHGTIRIHKHQDVASNPSSPGLLLQAKLLYCFAFDSPLLTHCRRLACFLCTIISPLRDRRMNKLSQKPKRKAIMAHYRGINLIPFLLQQ